MSKISWIKDYLTSELKIIVPENHETSYEEFKENINYTAACIADFRSIGFAVDEELKKKLLLLSKKEIVKLHKTYMPLLKEMVGGDKEYHPFYPNYPEGVKDLTELEYTVDQFIYCLTAVTIAPEMLAKPQEDFPFLGTKPKHILMLGGKEDYEKFIDQLLHSQTAWSPKQRLTVWHYLEYCTDQEDIHGHCIFLNLPSKENKVLFAGMLTVHIPFANKDAIAIMDHSTDILRYAVLLPQINEYKKEKKQNTNYATSDEDLERMLDTWANAVRLDQSVVREGFSLTRSERRAIAEGMEKLSKGSAHKLEVEMLNQKPCWKKLIRVLHVQHDFPQCKTFIEAIESICNNEAVDRPTRRISEVIKQKDYETALKELKKRPGDFVRQFDTIFNGLKMTKHDPEEAADVLAEVGKDSGINALLSLFGNEKQRREESETRTFYIPKKNTYHSIENKKPKLTDAEYEMVYSAIYQSLVNAFKGKDPMGKVYVSEKMKQYMVPSDIRNISESTETYTSGSVIDGTGDPDIVRFFVYWTNLKNGKQWEKRVDTDLSALVFGEDEENMFRIGWNAKRSALENENVFYFSGDVQDGGPYDGKGAAEYIDIDRKALLKYGYRYVLTFVNSYCGQPFIVQDHTAFGFMEREKGDMGKAFEPQSVLSKWNLRCNNTEEAAVLYDIKENTYTWIDKTLPRTVASWHKDPKITEVLSYVRKQQGRDLYTIAKANAEANGEIVDDPWKADIMFVTPAEYQNLQKQAEKLKEEFDTPSGYDSLAKKKIVFPYQLGYITGTLLKKGETK